MSDLDSISQNLITRERAGKLELLIHLLSNLTQSLVVCGPEGIGKTTLLDSLQEYQPGSWYYCYIQGHANLSFEEVLKHISRCLYSEGKNPLSPAQLLAVYGQVQMQNRKIILMIDDAGSLVPGLITSIMQYAEANAVIRALFVLTHDELFLVNRSDRAIENCHFIELPPLTFAQCGEFLQSIASKPKAPVALGDITDEMIERIYRESRGIPGKILAELPVLTRPKKGGNSFSWLLTLVLLLVMLISAIQWLRLERHQVGSSFLSMDKATQKTEAPENFDPEQDVILAPMTKAPEPAPVDAEEQAAVPEVDMATEQGEDVPVYSTSGDIETPSDGVAPLVQTPDAGGVAGQDNMALQADVDDVMPTAESAGNQTPLTEENPDDGLTWLHTQAPEKVTLQLMVMPKLEPVTALKQRYPDLAAEIRYAKREKYGKQRFIVFLGSFNDMAAAASQRESLPKELKSAMPRKIGSVINDLK